MTFLIAVPTGVKIFNWIGTMWKGHLTFESPMLFSLGFLITFLFGGLSGVLLASPPLDFQVTDTYFVVAHFHYVVFGTVVFATYARYLLLVPEDDRSHDGRAPWQVALLDHVRRLSHDVPRSALARCRGYAASLRRLPTRGRVHHTQYSLDHRFLHSRSLHSPVHLERLQELPIRRSGHCRRSVGLRKLAGVGQRPARRRVTTSPSCRASAASVRPSSCITRTWLLGCEQKHTSGPVTGRRRVHQNRRRYLPHPRPMMTRRISSAAIPMGKSMSTRTMPVVIVPATDTAAALLTDWLIRDVLPTALDGGVANHAGARLRTLPPVSRRHIRHPRKLRVHTRRVSEVIAAIENHLQTGADFVDAERTFMRSTTVLPDPVLNAAASISGAVMDIGSSAAALANRALLLVPTTIESSEAALSTQSRGNRILLRPPCAAVAQRFSREYRDSADRTLSAPRFGVLSRGGAHRSEIIRALDADSQSYGVETNEQSGGKAKRVATSSEESLSLPQAQPSGSGWSVFPPVLASADAAVFVDRVFDLVCVLRGSLLALVD